MAPAFLAVVLALSAAPGTVLASPPLPRPSGWATAVAGSGVQNLYRVESDLFRSAQPSSAGFQELAALGVKTVLNVAGGEGDAPVARGTDLNLLHVPMTAWGLRDDRVLEALRIMTNPRNRPLLIHCQHGADRTGAIMALYRVVAQGWSKADAVREMNEGGFHHSSLWRNLDDYVLKANVEALRRQLGIVSPAPSTVEALAAAHPSVPAAPVMADAPLGAPGPKAEPAQASSNR
jgi:tyrosine-protein phosphatase SIW14